MVVPGLSTTSSSFPSSTSMTPSRQEIDHPTSSLSSSTSTPRNVSSDSETRTREDLCGIDSYPVSVSSEHVERKERGDPLTKRTKSSKSYKNEDHDIEWWDPLYSDIPEWLQEFRENLVYDRVLERWDSHASSSHEPSLEPTPTRSVDLGNTVFILTSRKTEIARSARGPTSWGPRAEDALAEPYLVQKILEIWLQQITKFSVKVVNLEKIIDMQSWCRTWPPNGSSRLRPKQKLLRKPRGACKKFLEPNRKPKGHLHWQFLRIWQSLWRSFMESLYVDTTQIGNKWYCWKSSAQSKRRYLCCIVAIGSGWKLVGRFHGRLFLSAKRHRSVIWWENSTPETFWETI